MDSLVHDASLGINFNLDAVDKNMIPSGSLSVPDCRALPRLLLSCRKYSALREDVQALSSYTLEILLGLGLLQHQMLFVRYGRKQPVIRQGLLISTRKRHPKLRRCGSRPTLSRYQRRVVYFLLMDAEPSTSYS